MCFSAYIRYAIFIMFVTYRKCAYVCSCQLCLNLVEMVGRSTNVDGSGVATLPVIAEWLSVYCITTNFAGGIENVSDDCQNMGIFITNHLSTTKMLIRNTIKSEYSIYLNYYVFWIVNIRRQVSILIILLIIISEVAVTELVLSLPTTAEYLGFNNAADVCSLLTFCDTPCCLVCDVCHMFIFSTLVYTQELFMV